MKGIPNSEFDILSLVEGYLRTMHFGYSYTTDKIRETLYNPDNLIACMQKSVYENNKFDPNADRWQNVTPEQYQQLMSAVLNKLEHDITTAIDSAIKTLDQEFPIR